MQTLEKIFEHLVQNHMIAAVQTELEALSYPVPARYGEILAEKFFVFPNQPGTKKNRPYAWLSVDTKNGRLLQYSRCEADDFAASLGIPVGTPVDYSAPVSESFRKTLAAKKEFSETYRIVRGLAFKDELTEEEKGELQRYIALQKQVINEELFAFYRALSPEFYLWLDKNTT